MRSETTSSVFTVLDETKGCAREPNEKKPNVIPRVLLITNEPAPGRPPGFIDGLQLLVSDGSLADVHVVSAREGWRENPTVAFERVLEAMKDSRFDAVLILSPKDFPGTRERFEHLLNLLGSRTLIHWEGDPWGRGKPLPKPMTWWLARADYVFSVAGQPQVQILLNHGASRVHHCPHVYCHVRFAEGEKHPPPSHTEVGAVMIAGNYARIPLISGMPGSFGRWLLATRFRAARHREFRMYGRGWPSSWATHVPYTQQLDVIRRGSLSVNWDHYPAHADYFSDRLPISLLAGRPHITTRHPGMTWLPASEIGLFQEASPTGILRRAKSLWEMNPVELHRLGLEGHSWVVRRLSSREATRHMMSTAFPHIAPPTMEPWSCLPGPWE